MNLLNAVAQILRAAGEPLHVQAITKRLMAAGLWQAKGKTPDRTVGSCIYTDIQKKKSQSRFVKTAPSTFALRDSGQEQNHAIVDTKSISSVSEFIEWVDGLEGSIMYYRGLSNARWELEASGYRRIKNSSGGNTPTLRNFKADIGQLVKRAKFNRFDRQDGEKLSDLELLAELQHNGAATCLIDFTGNPLVALWFACRENPGQEGKVLAMRIDGDDTGAFAEVTYEKLEYPIDKFFSERKLWRWEPGYNNNRIIAQNSVFVFGRGKIEEQYYKAININEEAKEEICSKLQEKYSIDELHLFRDFTGFSLANAPDKPCRIYSKTDYYRQGILFYHKGDYKKAIEQYGKAIKEP